MRQIAVVCALIQNPHTAQWLVVQRSEHMPHPLAWEFPGGKVALGESEQTALMREIQEELDCAIALHERGRPVQHQVDEARRILLIPYRCSLLNGEAIRLKEHRQHQWLNWTDLPSCEGLLEADVDLVATNRLWGQRST